MTDKKCEQLANSVATSISEGDIFIYSYSTPLTSFEIKSISKEVNCAGHKYMNMSPSLIELATPLQLAFPVLFSKGRFGYNDERKIKLSPVNYFNARLLHYSGRFATNSEYLFFAQFVLEHKKVADSINIALKKIQGQLITASQIKSDVDKLKSMVCQDQAYLFLRQIPGTPSYW